jgi:hypothetical protein
MAARKDQYTDLILPTLAGFAAAVVIAVLQTLGIAEPITGPLFDFFNGAWTIVRTWAEQAMTGKVA